MDQLILEIVKKYQWVNSWSGNWPYFDGTVLRGDLSTNICGIPLRFIEVFVTQNGITTFYRSAERYEELNVQLIDMFKKNPGFIKKSASGYSKRVASDIRSLKEINKLKKLQNLSNEEIASLVEKTRKHFEFNGMIDIYDWYIERVFTPMLEKIITEKLTNLGKAELVSDYMSTLIMPHKISQIYRERQQLFSIVKYIRANTTILNAIKSGASLHEVIKADVIFKKIFKAYFRKYVWMPVLVNNNPHTEESVFQEISGYILSDAPLKINTKRLGDDHDESIIEKSFEYMKELKFSKREKLLVLGLRAMAFLRTEDYWVMSKSSYLVIPLYTEAARRIGLNYSELKQFFPNEITKHLRENKKIDHTEFQNRFELSCFVKLDDQEYFCVGEEANKIKDIIDGQLRSKKNTGEVSWNGVVGCKGIVKGRAVVALDPVEASQIKDGDILVVTITSAGFVPYLRKAGGIISEFGGLTSHQVIVAREFGIPCVVGIKDITKHVSTGDLIEVNADKGLVKLIKS